MTGANVGAGFAASEADGAAVADPVLGAMLDHWDAGLELGEVIGAKINTGFATTV